MRSTKKHRPKKGQTTTRKKNLHLPKALPPFPQIPPFQKAKKPGYDFYMYVNGNWIHAAKTPTFRAAFGVSEELEEIIKKQIGQILDDGVNEAKKGEEPKGSLQMSIDSVGRFGLSALRPSVQTQSIKLVKRMIQNIHCMRDKRDICKMLGEFSRYRISSLFSVYTYFESGKQVKVRLAMSIGQLGLPDTSYYFKLAPGKSKTLFAYGAMLDRIGHLLELDETLSAVIPIESYFASEILKTQNQNDTMIKGEDFPKEFPGIDWEAFWMGVGLKTWERTSMKVVTPGWIRSIQKAFKNLTIDQWKLLLTAHLVLHAVSLLPPPYDDIHFEFYEKRLRGQQKKLPQRELTIRLLQEWMPSTLSKLYLRDFVNPTIKQRVTDFVNLVLAAAVNRITETEWLQPTTRKKAIEKVEKMRMGIAYPDKMPVFPELHLETDNLFKNILLLGEDHTNTELSKLNKVIDIESTWDDAIYAVNAYYYSEVNQFILPVGSLQWPFYHHEAPRGWNFGGLGAIVAHEITHAFDSDGKDYDANGERKNWWTPADNRAYTKRKNAIIKLFNKAVIQGHPVNGALTLNENIADLGGLAIALDALKLEIKRDHLSADEELEAYRNFFIAYAVSWRIKEKPAKILQGLFLDRHAPAPFRVNFIVNQFDEWYAAFDIQVEDKLYVPPEERIRIF